MLAQYLTPKRTWIILLGLLVVISTAYLHRVPGLTGDEAAESYEAYKVLEQSGIKPVGINKYVGPLTDYLRVPFIAVFGYTVLASRVLMVLASIAFFALLHRLLSKHYEPDTALLVTAAIVFSPAYLAHQRLGWAIALFPLLTLVALWLAQSKISQRYLLAGLVVGLAAHIHVLYLAMVAALAVGLVVYLLPAWKKILSWWPAVVGFAAGFGTQAILVYQHSQDPDNFASRGSTFFEKLAELPQALPDLLSGAAYFARYTGQMPSAGLAGLISLAIILLALLAVVLRRDRHTTVWLLVLLVHGCALVFLVERYIPRYFTTLVLGSWGLAGLGLAELVTRFRAQAAVSLVAVTVVLAGSVAFVTLVMVPFLQSGGSVAQFRIGSELENANHSVDTRGLVACLRGAGSVIEQGHLNGYRLQYLALQYPDIVHVDDNAEWRIATREQRHVPVDRSAEERCPELPHFSVIKQ